MLTAMICVEWSYDVRRDHVWEFYPLPICIQDREGLCVCPPTNIWCVHNNCSIQRVCIWGHRKWTHEELYPAQILVSVGCNVQDPHAIYQRYEEFLMGGNPTVCNFCRNHYFSWESGSFKGGWVVYHEYGRTSWCLDPWSPDTVETCFYGFLVLVTHVLYLT